MCGSQGDYMAEAVFVARQKLTCRLFPLRVLEEARLTYHDSSSKLTSDDMQVIRSFGQVQGQNFLPSSRAGPLASRARRVFIASCITCDHGGMGLADTCQGDVGVSTSKEHAQRMRA